MLPKPMSVFTLISFALQVLVLPTFAQSNTVRFDHLSSENGLSHATVNCMVQDRQGFMWFGTKDGLNRYDGYNFLLFEHDPTAKNSLSDNTIQALCEDHTGTLWIGTSHGLNQFDQATHTFTVFDLHTKKGRGDNNITAIYEDHAHTLWVASTEGLSKFDSINRTFVLYEPSPQQDAWAFNAIHTVYEDRIHTLWVGTNQGLSSFNPRTSHFNRFPPPTLARTDLPFPNAVKAIKEDNTGVLWLGTADNGLQQFDPTSHTFKVYRHDPGDARSISSNAILSLCEDAFGSLWIATQYGGLNRLERSSGTFTRYQHDPGNFQSIVTNSLISLYVDRFRVLWIGTYAAGIDKVDLLRKRIDHFKHNPATVQSIRDNYVYSLLATASGTVWIGNQVGLDKLERKTGQYTHYTYSRSPSQSSNTTTLCLHEDRSANLWIGLASGGLKKFSPLSQQFTTYLNNPADSSSLAHNYVKAICEDKNGILWIGTLNGLCRYDGRSGHFTTYKPTRTRSKRFDIAYLITNRAGTLWLATSHDGLLEFDPFKGTFTPYAFRGQAAASGRETNVAYVYEDQAGGVWASLKEGGLYHLDHKSASFVLVTYPQELARTVISGILEDERGNLWLSTRKNGILKFNPATKAMHHYDASDGLQGNDFNRALCRSATGELYFGGNNGFNVFHPDSIQDNPFPPPVAITGFKVFDKPRSFTNDQFELPYSDNFFSFDFAALHYALPEKNRYAYRLEGFDQQWRQAGSRRYASYTNVDPGEYVFRVKAANNDGVWNQQGAAIKIIITPPVWKTWWFRGSGALLIFALAWATHRARIHQITARNQVLEARIRERTQQIEQQKEEIESQRDTLQLFNQEITHQNEVLERKVEERTQELQTSNEELRQNLELSVSLNTKLTEQENFLSSILDQTPFSTSISDAAGTSIRVNRSFLALFGVDDIREVVGKYNIFRDNTFIGQPFYPAIEAVFTEGKIARFELQYDLDRASQSHGFADKQVYLVVTIFPIKDTDGKVVNAVIQHEDITERKKAEEALEAKNEELKKINVDLDNFVYMASHDLKAPIANLEGLASVLTKRLDGKLNEMDREMMHMISLSTAKLKGTILDLTEITKVQKEIDNTPDSVSFEEIMTDIQENVSPLIEESGAVIATDFAVECIQYTRKNLRSILYNLLVNALKYRSPDRAPRIRIQTRQLPNYVLLSVEDNGLGIATHQQHKLFTMFQRLHTHVEGTGIGLYIIKRIIENNGGKIELQSEEGKGTVFHVFFKGESES